MAAKQYTKKRLAKDANHIEMTAILRPQNTRAECRPLEVRIRVPYDGSNQSLNDNPEKVIKAFLAGSYDLIKRDVD